MAKRKRTCTLKVIEKKQKVGIIPTSPLEMGDLLAKIASNLKGMDLINFRRVNKTFYITAKDMDDMIEIGMDNFKEACSMKGRHSISLEKIYNWKCSIDVTPEEMFDDEVRRCKEKEITFPNVRHLTIDYCHMDNFFNEDMVFLFPELRELRFIRAVTHIYLDISEVKLPKLRKLAIYTKKHVNLVMDRDLEEIQLYSQLGKRTSFQIHKMNKIDDKRIKAYGGGFTYTYSDCYHINCEMKAFYDFKMAHPNSSTTYHTFDYPFIPMPRGSPSKTYKGFKPNPKFI